MKPLKILLEIQEKDLKIDALGIEEKKLNEKSAIFKLTEEV